MIKKFKADPEVSKEESEISAIIHKHERLCLSSWNKTVIVYHLNSSGVQFLFKYPKLHTGIILAMDSYLNKLATASYDGKIIFWSIEIGLPMCEFRLEESINLEFVDRSVDAIKSYQKKNLERAKFDDFLENNNYFTEKIQFLHTRVINKQIVNLFSGGALGWIKAWSTDFSGSMLAQFNAAHNEYDNITNFCLDQNEMLLFTGYNSTIYIFLFLEFISNLLDVLFNSFMRLET